MLDYKDIIIKHYVLEMSDSEIARQLNTSKSGVNDFLRAFKKCETLSFPLPEGTTNYGIAEHVYGSLPGSGGRELSYEFPDFQEVAGMMDTRKNMTLVFLWNRYKRRCLDEEKKCYQYRQFCDLYAGWCEENYETCELSKLKSLNRMGEVKECVKNYGMVIVDECHHVSAFSFEEVLKNVNAKYVYGLTATPTRKDGHHPIIFMQCGPIRFRDDAKKQAEKRPFEHYIIPRFTSLRVPIDKEEKDVTIQELYAEIVENEMRNQLIFDDVVRSHECGRNCLVLTERTAHVEFLTKELGKRIPDVISATGGMSTKETRETMARIANTPLDRPLTLVATGKYIGEGFDEPRLDTLFLAMPISWKGTLQQYAGRLHRLFDGKNEVQIYDYVDIHVRMLEKMYSKRLTGYASIGYKAKGESIATEFHGYYF